MTKDNLTERRVDEFLDKYMMLPATDKHGPTKHIVREILIRYDAQQQALLGECAIADRLWRSGLISGQEAMVQISESLTRLRADHG